MSRGDLIARALKLRTQRQKQDRARRDRLVRAAVHALAGNSKKAAPATGVTTTTATAAYATLTHLYPIANVAGVMRFGGRRPVPNARRTQMALPVTSIEPATRCLVPAIDGATTTSEWKEALWARFYTGAPRRQRSSVERYSIVKRA